MAFISSCVKTRKALISLEALEPGQLIRRVKKKDTERQQKSVPVARMVGNIA